MNYFLKSLSVLELSGGFNNKWNGFFLKIWVQILSYCQLATDMSRSAAIDMALLKFYADYVP